MTRTIACWLATGPTQGPMRVPVDPPLSPDDIEIDLGNLTEDAVPVSRTTTPRMDEVALAALVERTRK